MHQPSHTIHVLETILVPCCNVFQQTFPFTINNKSPFLESTQVDTTKTHFNCSIGPLSHISSRTKAKKLQKIALTLNSPHQNSFVITYVVVTLALGLRIKQKGCKVASQEGEWESRQRGRKGAGQEEAQESHHIFPRV